MTQSSTLTPISKDDLLMRIYQLSKKKYLLMKDFTQNDALRIEEICRLTREINDMKWELKGAGE